MKSKIIITGGLGFLGQHIVKEVALRYKDKKILVLARSEKKLWVFKKIPKHLELKINAHIDKPSTYEHLIEKDDIVIHNAGFVSYKKSDKEKIYRSNFLATQKILKISATKNVKKFVMISSISAIGIENNYGTEEIYPEAKKISHEFYSHSKLIAELEVKKYRRKLNYTILNPSVMIGPGANYLKSFFSILQKFPIVPSISVANSFVDARDVASATVLAIDSNLKHERFILTTYNINDLEFIKKALQVLKRRKRIVKIPRVFIHTLNFLAHISEKFGGYPFTKKPRSFLQDKSYSSRKARNLLGWKPKYSLKKSLSDTLSWINNGY